MLRVSKTVVVAGALAALVLSDASAQVSTRSLSSPDARFPEAFGSITGLRELPDGRVMIADPLGQALSVIDLDAGTADTLGRVGGGPQEYKQPDALFGLPGDSTLMLDLGNARLTAIGPRGGFGGTMPVTHGQPGGGGPGSMLLVIPRGTDDVGRVYFQPMGGFRPGGAPPDSGAVVRLDRTTMAMDTVGMVKLQGRDIQTSGGGNNRNVRMTPKPMSPQDGWAVGWDGRVAFVRSADYSVHWIHPDGRTVNGDPNDYDPVSVGRAEKEDYLESTRGSGLQVGITIDNGVRQTSLSRGGGGSSGPGIDDYQWPDAMPAFQADRVFVSPEGDAWVQRYVRASDAPTFDIFGEDGNLKGRVTLPEGRRLVGFGKGSVYLSVRDEFDLQYLERYSVTS
jgi:hypothetical protein